MLILVVTSSPKATVRPAKQDSDQSTESTTEHASYWSTFTTTYSTTNGRTDKTAIDAAFASTIFPSYISTIEATHTTAHS